MVVGLETPLVHFSVSLELEVLEEASEGSFQFIKRTTEFKLKFDEC